VGFVVELDDEFGFECGGIAEDEVDGFAVDFVLVGLPLGDAGSGIDEFAVVDLGEIGSNAHRMKIILSRKGFDSGYGGVPSPIFPNGRMVSLPIPDELGTKTYRDIGRGGFGLPNSSIGEVVEALTEGEVSADAVAHVDPDLDETSMTRLPGWRPAFGQAQAAQGHLDNQGVGVGDLFLFYGWFKRVRPSGDGWTFEDGAPDLHVVFGWLCVGERIEVRPGSEPSALRSRAWLRDHPHMHVPPSMLRGRNVVFTASDELVLPSFRVRGAGIFPKLRSELVLTHPMGGERSIWRVPRCFAESDDYPALTYHAKPGRWAFEGEHARLRAVYRGQEFVLDCEQRPEAVGWVSRLFSQTAASDSV